MASGTGPQVVIIPFENTNYTSGKGAVYNNPAICTLAGGGTQPCYGTFQSSADQYYDLNDGNNSTVGRRFWALWHPSLPNYYNFTGGSNFGETADTVISPTTGINVNNIFRQITAAGLTWKVYAEDYKFHTNEVCFAAPAYSQHHDPGSFYTDTVSTPARHVDFDTLVTDINNNNVSDDYIWIVPNKEDDGHDTNNTGTGPLATACYSQGFLDRWLQGLNPRKDAATRAFPGLAKLRAAMRPGGLVILWFDESAGQGTGLLNPDNRAYCAVVGAGVQGKPLATKPGGTDWNHSDLLLGIQQLFNTAYPGKFPKWTTTGNASYQLQSTYLNGVAVDLGGGTVVLSPPSYVSGANVSGSLVEPGTLTANAGSWNGNPAPTFTYLFQWATSAGATTWNNIGTDSSTNTYNTTSTDLTRFIRCQVTGHNSQGTGGPIFTAAVGPITGTAPGVPVNTSLPQITGLAQVDSTLTTSTGAWNPSGTPAYQWQRQPSGGSFGNITGATGQTYLLVSADQNAMIRVQVTETNGSGPSLPATAAAVGPVGASPNTAPQNTSPPTVSGTVQQGQTLTANAGTWTGTPTPTVSGYQWQSSATATGTFTNLALGTSQTFLIPNDSSLVGLFIRVRVTESNTFGGVTHSTTANSLAVGPVQAVVVGQAPQNQTPPQISGTLQVNSTLTEFGDTWTGTTPMTPGYQWQRQASGLTSWANIGTNINTYLLVQADAAALIRVTVTETNSVSSTPATSLPVGPIASDTTPPSVPTALHTTLVATNEVDLAWTASTDTGGSGLRGYVLKRNATLITLGLATTYKDTGVQPGTTYTYSIAAVDNNQNQSAFSSTISATTTSIPDTTAPSTPTGLAGTVPLQVGTEVDLHWNAATDNVGVTAYRLTRMGVSSPTPAAVPTITGTLTVGSTLTEVNAQWLNGLITSRRYQWQSDFSGTMQDVAGETGQSYVVRTADGGHNVRVEEWASNATGESTLPQVSASVAITAVATLPTPLATPTINGAAQETQTLTETNGTWTNGPILSRRYQWRRKPSGASGFTDISTGTGQTYVLTSNDVGATIICDEWATNSSGESLSPQVSNTLGPVTANLTIPAATSPAVAPTISGTLTSGSTLTETHAHWTNTPTTYRYQWQRKTATASSFSDIATATGQTYQLGDVDIAATIRVEEWASNAAGESSTPQISAGTGVVQGAQLGNYVNRTSTVNLLLVPLRFTSGGTTYTASLPSGNVATEYSHINGMWTGASYGVFPGFTTTVSTVMTAATPPNLNSDPNVLTTLAGDVGPKLTTAGYTLSSFDQIVCYAAQAYVGDPTTGSFIEGVSNATYAVPNWSVIGDGSISGVTQASFTSSGETVWDGVTATGAHELGHTLGVGHAGSSYDHTSGVACNGFDPTMNFKEYAGFPCVMSQGPWAGVNAPMRAWLGWMANRVKIIDLSKLASGTTTYTISPLEAATAVNPQALMIYDPTDYEFMGALHGEWDSFWFELRVPDATEYNLFPTVSSVMGTGLYGYLSNFYGTARDPQAVLATGHVPDQIYTNNIWSSAQNAGDPLQRAWVLNEQLTTFKGNLTLKSTAISSTAATIQLAWTKPAAPATPSLVLKDIQGNTITNGGSTANFAFNATVTTTNAGKVIPTLTGGGAGASIPAGVNPYTEPGPGGVGEQAVFSVNATPHGGATTLSVAAQNAGGTSGSASITFTIT